MCRVYNLNVGCNPWLNVSADVTIYLVIIISAKLDVGKGAVKILYEYNISYYPFLFK